MTLFLTLFGIVLATLSHLTVSRHHQAPKGWAYVWAVYEVSIPALLAGVILWPEYKGVLLAIAAFCAMLIGSSAAVVATNLQPRIAEEKTNAKVGEFTLRAMGPSRNVDGSSEGDKDPRPLSRDRLRESVASMDYYEEARKAVAARDERDRARLLHRS